jgi:hypothetical protein
LLNDMLHFTAIPPQAITLRDVTATQWDGTRPPRAAFLLPLPFPPPLMFTWAPQAPQTSFISEGGGHRFVPPVRIDRTSSLPTSMTDLSVDERSTRNDTTDNVIVEVPGVRVSLKKCSNFSPQVPLPKLVDSKDTSGNPIRRLHFHVPEKVLYKVVDTRSMVTGLFGSCILPSSLKEIGEVGSGRFVPSTLAPKSGWNYIVEHIIPTLFPDHLRTMHKDKVYFSSCKHLHWNILEANCELVPQSASLMHWKVSCECAEKRKGSQCCPLTAVVGGVWGTFYFDKSGDLVVEKPCTCVTLILNNDGRCIHEEVTTEGYLRGTEKRKELARLVVENGPTKVRYVHSVHVYMFC